MVARTLITTADERTWPEEIKQPVLFLGEWCRRYSRKDVWEQLDAELAPYHWDDRKKLFRDYQHIQKLYENILAELSDKLNHIHSVEHSYRYWRILIGPWLGYFIQMLFDRWFMMKQVIEQTKIADCFVLERDPMSVVANDMTHFNKLFVGDDWNEAIYGQLLVLCWGDVVNIKRVKGLAVDSETLRPASQGFKTTLKEYAFKGLSLLFNMLSLKDDEYFFISTYLPLKINIKLQLRLGQLPKKWRSDPIIITKPDIKKRLWKLGRGRDKSESSSFEVIVRQLISQHLPIVYLEGYKRLVTQADMLGWPNKPKAIFTCSAYSGDDIFKAWAAEKIEIGIPLVIGQHGGHMGMNPFAFHEEHQITISDKWLSWGWSDKKDYR